MKLLLPIVMFAMSGAIAAPFEAASVAGEVRVTSIDPKGATSVVVRVDVPIRGIDEIWLPDQIKPIQGRKWWLKRLSAPQSDIPFIAYFAADGENALSFGSSSLAYDNELFSKINQEKGVFELCLTVVTQGEPIKPFKVTVDRRPGDWTNALNAWRDALEFPKGPYPSGAWKPVYCTWYAAHAAFDQDWVERTAKVSADLGFKTFILDDGWSYDDKKRVNPQMISTWYQDIGRWDTFSKKKFPDFAAHRERMRKLGINYLVWVAPYLVGTRTPIYREGRFEEKGATPFEGKIVADVADTALMNRVSDEIVRLFKETDLDGVKIDFLDSCLASVEKPRAAASLAYVTDLVKRLREVKPDCLIEFRQGYATPILASCATQFRANDVPLDWQANLLELAQLRLTMGDGVPLHADPIYYSRYETSDNIDRHYMAAMAGVPMVSMDLEKLDAAERQRVTRWLDFYGKRVEKFQREGRWSVRYRNGSLVALYSVCGNAALALVCDPAIMPEVDTALAGKSVLLLNLTHATLPMRGVSVPPAAYRDIPPTANLQPSASAVTLVDVMDIASVAARTNTVQGDLIAIRSALTSARTAAKGGWILLVKSPRALDRDNMLNDALDHFADGQVVVCAPDKLRETLTRLDNETRRPSTVRADSSKWSNDFWRKRCAEKQTEIAANESHVYDLVMFGDSITHNFERDDAWGVYAKFGGFGKTVWDGAFKDLKRLDIGIGGDRTQDLLWRGMNGDLDNYKARVITVMIGTNNVRVNSPEEIAAGVKAVVEMVKAKHPESKILLYAIFPRGQKGDDYLRLKNEKANAIIKTFADGDRVVWRDINAKLVDPDGTMHQEMMPDYLHPTPKGYQIWADDILPFVREAQKKPIDVKRFKPTETPIAKLVAMDKTMAERDAWQKANVVKPCAPSLHDGRINYFAEIRRRIAAVGGEADLVLFGMNAATGLKFENLKTIAIGVGETVEQVPWNALTGDFDGYKAKWIALGIDQSHDTPDKTTFEALRQTLEIVRAKQPKAKIILLAAAPGGQDANDEMRRYILRHNAWAKALCDGKSVVWCDYSEGFYLPDGKMNPEMLKGEFNFTDKAKELLKKAILDTMAGKPPAFATAPAPGYDVTRLTLMHYNIHSGWGKDGQKWNLWDPIAVIKKVAPDVCTLNEVTWNGAAKGFQVDEPMIMGHILNPMWRTALGPSKVEADGTAYGNVVLYCDEALSEKVLPLPAGTVAYKQPRSFVAVEFPKYWVGTSHFPFGLDSQLKSVEIIAKWAAEQKKPVFFTGDWNAEPSGKTFEAIKKHFVILSDTSKFTFCSTRPHATIDYIAVDKAHAAQVTVDSFNVLDEPDGSDHLPLVMKLSIKEGHVTLSDKPTPASSDANHWWMKAAEYRDNQAREGANADVVWLGDSITHYFDNPGPKSDLWKKYFGGPASGAPYLGLNFGIEGDTTDNLLWRIEKSLAKTHPKAIILNIGTNNTGKRSEKTETPDDTIKGLKKVIEEVRRIEPQATIFVYALFPRGKGVTDPCMIRNEKVNAGLEKLCDGKQVVWCDIRKKFLKDDGTVDETLLEDRLHPAPKGYEVWLADVLPRLEKLMGTPKGGVK